MELDLSTWDGFIKSMQRDPFSCLAGYLIIGVALAIFVGSFLDDWNRANRIIMRFLIILTWPILGIGFVLFYFLKALFS